LAWCRKLRRNQRRKPLPGNKLPLSALEHNMVLAGPSFDASITHELAQPDNDLVTGKARVLLRACVALARAVLVLTAK
jgi:hypothetical protein